MADKWYVCYCEPKKALKLVEELKSLGAEAECPSFEYRRRVPRKNRVEVLEKPLVGGTFFLGVDCWPLSGSILGLDLSCIRRMKKPDGSIAFIDDKELDGLRVASGEISRDRRSIHEGDAVEFCFGPFKGKQARVLGMKQGVVRLELKGIPGSVEIAPFLLRKIQA